MEENYSLGDMEPEKFLTLVQFNTLLKATKDNRELCILNLLGIAGLRAAELVGCC
jgi:hypothetical protein